MWFKQRVCLNPEHYQETIPEFGSQIWKSYYLEYECISIYPSIHPSIQSACIEVIAYAFKSTYQLPQGHQIQSKKQRVQNRTLGNPTGERCCWWGIFKWKKHLPWYIFKIICMFLYIFSYSIIYICFLNLLSIIYLYELHCIFDNCKRARTNTFTIHIYTKTLIF